MWNVVKKLFFFGAIGSFHRGEVPGGVGLFGEHHAHIAEVVFEEVIVLELVSTVAIGEVAFYIAEPAFFMTDELQGTVFVDGAL